MVELPQIRSRRKTEQVIDARMCVLNHCAFLQTGIDRQSGEVVRTCGAGVFRAQLPAAALHDLTQDNPAPVPGAKADDNPFLLRLLMARECLRPECGVAEIDYVERVLEIDPAELSTELFS